MNAPAAARTPVHVAGYRLERELGRGRNCVVHLAVQPDGRPVALKIARKPHVDFKREFAAQAALADRHVIEVLDCGWSGSDAYLSMEYAAGGPVRGPMPHAAVARIVEQAARALDRLHRHGWVHRDIKPAHLLLRADGSMALADFGCACRAGQVDALPPGTVVGTPRYAAPEQSGGAAAAPSADVYGLGACLHELLTGEPPFAGETLTELLGQHLVAAVPRLPREHAQWQALLDAMMAKDASARPADGQAVFNQLQRMEHSH